MPLVLSTPASRWVTVRSGSRLYRSPRTSLVRSTAMEPNQKRPAGSTLPSLKWVSGRSASMADTRVLAPVAGSR